jgi:hypothetical protein
MLSANETKKSIENKGFPNVFNAFRVGGGEGSRTLLKALKNKGLKGA